MYRISQVVACATLVSLTAGCAGMSHTENGALLGTGLGTTAGAIIGHQTGHAGAGALIGAATGALAGSAIGSAEDAREERDAALAYAHHVQQSSTALTNSDIVSMVRNGLNDQIILGSVKQSGGRFDLSPHALIQLKQQGVSDELIQNLQRYQTQPPAPLIVQEPPPVIVRPTVYARPIVRPRVSFSYGHYWRGGHRHRRRW